MELKSQIEAARRTVRADDRLGAHRAGCDEWRHATHLVCRNVQSVRRVLEAYAERCAKMGVCDRAAAKKAVTRMYTAMGLSKPRFVWFDSPLRAAQCAALILLDNASRKCESAGQWLRLGDHIDREQAGLMSDSMLAAATPGNNDILAEAVFREQNSIDIAFTDHDSVIAQALISRWDRAWAEGTNSLEWFSRGAGSAAVIAAAGDEFARVRLGLTQFHVYQQWIILGRALQTVLWRVSRFNRLTGCRLGAGDAWELAVIDACDLFGQGKGRGFSALFDTMQECGWWWPFSDVCVMCDRPVELSTSSWMLHGTNGPAVRYSDGFELYFLKDILVPEYIARGQFAATDIDKEPNVEVRRVMVDRYGVEAYLAETGAVPVQEDECGVLYRKEMADDEDLTIIRVRNSTPEADGTYKHYFLRVPPHMETAREAVAWTFGMNEDDYAPLLQT